MNDQIPTTVSLEGLKAGDNLVRVDVVLENAPENLFGAAFHLKTGGAGWSLENYEKGDSFPADVALPLMLAEEKIVSGGDKEIVFGVSLIRSDDVHIRDGTLASFYLQTEGQGSLTLEFADAHLSVLGEVRKDIENAKWESKTINPGDLRPGRELLPADSILREGQDSLFNIELTAVYTVMAVCMLIIITGAAAFLLWKRWRRVKA